MPIASYWNSISHRHRQRNVCRPGHAILSSSYQPFGQQPPFGFAPTPAQMFYGGMQGQPQPVPGTAVLPPLSENNHMSVDTPTHLTATDSQSGQGRHVNAVPSSLRDGIAAGSFHGNGMIIAERQHIDDPHISINTTWSRWCSPSQDRDICDDRNGSIPHDRKGKSKALMSLQSLYAQNSRILPAN